MTVETIKKSGIKADFKDDRGGAVLISTPVIGIVKDNIDPTHSGRIKVYIAKFPGNDPDDPGTWLMVKYLSPFFGTIAPGYNVYGNKNKDDYGSFKGNPHSYGFWGSAPDIGSEVICIFVNGDPQDGYYIGSVPIIGLNHMVPAIGASNKVIPNQGESTTYSGADRLPVVEVNYSNSGIRNNPNLYNEPKPVHSFQAAILAKQGLIRDNLRGVISSSSQRETPSKVFGISTPGGPIYEGGFTNATIEQGLTPENTAKLQVVGRTGGHSIVMDDGNYKGQDQLMRLRTAAGHMIMMNDVGQVLTIIHSNGQSYIEFGKEGTIDMFSTNSVNIRTQGDFNVHADQDVNIHAKRNLNVFAENINVESDKNTKFRIGQNFEQYAIGKFTVKVDQQMSLFSTGNSSFTSDATNYIVGSKVHLNTGNTGAIPEVVNVIPKINHVDTTFSQTVGWMNPSPNPLLSVASRAPAHMPWVGANKGVDVKVDDAQPVSPPQPSASVQAATAAAGATPTNPTTPALAATVPSVNTDNSNPIKQLPGSTVAAMASQNAVNAATSSVTQKIEKGIAPGAAGVTFQQLSAPGQAMKPGSGDFVKQLQQLSPNLPIDKLATNVLMTGNNGVTDAIKMATNTSAQLSAFGSAVEKATTGLNLNNVLTGKESPTQAAGVVMAAATQGVSAVTNALKSPQGAASVANTDLGKSIASGTFAGMMADKLSSGLSGVVDSIGSMAGNVLNSVSSGISNALGKIGGGISSLVGGLAGAAKTAFAAAEKSFGELKAGAPNVLGGAKLPELPATPFLDNAVKLNKATAELTEAQKDLVQATKAYKVEESAETYSALKAAENAVASAEQKIAKIKEDVTSSLASNSDNKTSVSTQSLSTIANAAASGQLNMPTSLNTGINALPGGVGAFVNKVSSTTTNVVGSVKNLTATLGGAASTLLNPTKLVGNLTNNVKNAIGSVSQLASGGVQSLTGLVSGAQGAIDKLAGNASSLAAGLKSNLTAQLGSLGNGPAQIKQAILAADTYATKIAVNAKLTSVMGDPAIPAPVYEEVAVDESPDETQQEQLTAQQKLQEIYSEREAMALEISVLIETYASTQDVSLLSQIDDKNVQIQMLDEELVVAQEAYDRILSA